ncbi:Nbp2 protein [Martiniozyma asiatica (nom. inval.)]|nr:Nbp2 protein [Martiniozyma asiatica]
MTAVHVKDFAYPVSHPRHFGLPVESDDEDYDLYHRNDDSDQDDIERVENYSDDEFNELDEKYKNRDKEGITDEFNSIDEEGYEFKFNQEESKNQKKEEEFTSAVALYAFTPENDNELALIPGQRVLINDLRDFGGWLVAHDEVTGATGLVPSQYVSIEQLVEKTQELHL